MAHSNAKAFIAAKITSYTTHNRWFTWEKLYYRSAKMKCFWPNMKGVRMATNFHFHELVLKSIVENLASQCRTDSKPFNICKEDVS